MGPRPPVVFYWFLRDCCGEKNAVGTRATGKTSIGTDDSRRRFRSGVFIADWWFLAASILIVLGCTVPYRTWPSGPSGFGGAGGGVPSGGSPMLPVKAFAAGINTPMPVSIVPPTLYDKGGRGCSGPKLSEMPGQFM